MAVYQNTEIERAAMAMLGRLGYINPPDEGLVTITAAGIAALLDSIDNVETIEMTSPKAVNK